MSAHAATGVSSSFFGFFGVVFFGLVAETGDWIAALVGVAGATLVLMAAAAAAAAFI